MGIEKENLRGKKVLVIKLYSFGDIVQTTPALRALKNSGAEVHFLCADRVRDIALLLDGADRVHTFDPGKIAEFLRITAVLRREKFDIAVNFHRDRKSYIFTQMLGARRNSGFRWKQLGKSLDFSAEFNPALHETERYLSVTDAAGAQRQRWHTRIKIPEAPEVKIDIPDTAVNIGLFPGGGVNPGTVMFTKRWPVENFIELGKIISARGAGVFVFGGEMDRVNVEKTAGAVPGAVEVITGMADFVHYVSKMSCFAGPDTGPLHIAAAAGVNTIGLFGPSSPDVFGARGGNSVNITADESCPPCYEPESVHKKEFLKCTDNICMKKIKVSKVLEEIKKMLGERF
ncbi:MAG: glycosyltransferase family 9 protein [bacterium]